MKIKQDYTETAKANENIFRMILDTFEVPHQKMTIDEIYTKYSEGRRYGIWTILDFKEKESGIFEFSSENIATLSGSGSCKKFTLEDGKLKHITNTMIWRS